MRLVKLLVNEPRLGGARPRRNPPRLLPRVLRFEAHSGKSTASVCGAPRCLMDVADVVAVVVGESVAVQRERPEEGRHFGCIAVAVFEEDGVGPEPVVGERGQERAVAALGVDLCRIQIFNSTSM